MTDRELMQMALDALKFGLHVGFDESSESQIKKGGKAFDQHSKAITALRERLAQPEQEPVAWKDAPSKIYLQVCDESDCDQPFDSHIEVSWCHDKINDSDIAYIRADTAPPQRKPLTIQERDAQRWRFLMENSYDSQSVTQFHVWEHSWEPHSQTGEPTEWQQRVRGIALIDFIDRAIEAKLKEKNGF